MAYTAESIEVLEGLEAVRRRPAMYIGGTNSAGLHHLVDEVVDNCVDEALAGECSKIEVSLGEDGYVTVADNGRGIPVGKHPKMNRPALEVVMTTLHAGGKFDGKAYQVSGGLHGVGISVVNALSEHLVAEVHTKGKKYVQEYRRGEPTGDVKVRGKASDTGTIISFKPDPEIFPLDAIELDYEVLSERLRQMAFLVPKLEFAISDRHTGQRSDLLLRGRHQVVRGKHRPSPQTHNSASNLRRGRGRRDLHCRGHAVHGQLLRGHISICKHRAQRRWWNPSFRISRGIDADAQ